MKKIFKIQIPNWFRFHDSRHGETARMVLESHEHVHWDHGEGTVSWYDLVSTPMPEQMARKIMSDLNEIGITADLHDLTGEYRIAWTRAPQAYDYGYVVELGPAKSSGFDGRLVAIPRRSYEYQTGRYMSGLHPVREWSEEN